MKFSTHAIAVTALLANSALAAPVSKGVHTSAAHAAHDTSMPTNDIAHTFKDAILHPYRTISEAIKVQTRDVEQAKDLQTRKNKNKDEPLAMGPDDTTPCWTYENIGAIPNICLSPSGKTYIYTKEQAKELAALWSARYNNLQYGPDKGTAEYIKEEQEREKNGKNSARKNKNTKNTKGKDEPLAMGPDDTTPCWTYENIGVIPDICSSPSGKTYIYAKEQAKEKAAFWTARFESLQYGADKGTAEYTKEEQEREKNGKRRVTNTF